WPAAGDGEADACLAQPLHGSLRTLSEHLLLIDERAVHIRQDERNLPLVCHKTLVVTSQSSGRQARPSRASSSSAAAGPFLPAIYFGKFRGGLWARVSRIGCTARHPASMLSARWNSVASPIMQS